MKILFTLLAGLVAAPPALAQDYMPPGASVTIEEWEVPWPGSRPRDPYPGPDGRIWFVGQTADYVAALDPATGDDSPLGDEIGRTDVEIAPRAD